MLICLIFRQRNIKMNNAELTTHEFSRFVGDVDSASRFLSVYLVGADDHGSPYFYCGQNRSSVPTRLSLSSEGGKIKNSVEIPSFFEQIIKNVPTLLLRDLKNFLSSHKTHYLFNFIIGQFHPNVNRSIRHNIFR